MQPFPLRLLPGQDLRTALQDVLGEQQAHAAFVIQGIGSLSSAGIRCAGRSSALELRGDMEILTLAGTLAPDGAHLHISVSDAEGNVTGGHVETGCVIRTTAEILLVLLPEHHFSRTHDALSGYKELQIERKT